MEVNRINENLDCLSFRLAMSYVPRVPRTTYLAESREVIPAKARRSQRVTLEYLDLQIHGRCLWKA